jgi:hypothetical protein
MSKRTIPAPALYDRIARVASISLQHGSSVEKIRELLLSARFRGSRSRQAAVPLQVDLRFPQGACVPWKVT